MAFCLGAAHQCTFDPTGAVQAEQEYYHPTAAGPKTILITAAGPKTTDYFKECYSDPRPVQPSPTYCG